MLKSLFNQRSNDKGRIDHDYSMRGDIEDIGRIATNSHQEFRGVESTEKKEKRRTEKLLSKISSDLYSNMSGWSLSDFETNGAIYRGWLNDQAENAYQNGNADRGNSLSETAHDFFVKEQDILDNNDLTKMQKKEALQGLWKDQDQELIEEFISQYDDPASGLVLKSKNEELRNAIKSPDKIPVVTSDTTKIPGLDI